jgi:hypothetical protein
MRPAAQSRRPRSVPHSSGMGIIASVLAITAGGLLLTLLAAVRAGTRRQEDAGTLAGRAPGVAATLTRRITGLYAEPPARATGCPVRKASLTSDGSRES